MSDQQESPAQQPAAQPQVVYVEKKPEKKRPSCLSMIGGTVVLIVVLAVIGSLASKGPTTNTNDASKSSSGSGNSATSPTPTPVPVRQVQGTAATLGAGTFAGGKDVADGLYDVTPGAGESGNFIVTGTDEANDVLGSAGGLGVSKVRARISEGDSIQISSLSRVTFTPVTAPFVTDYKPATLYAGTFTVGQDIGAGRYVATRQRRERKLHRERQRLGRRDPGLRRRPRRPERHLQSDRRGRHQHLQPQPGEPRA